MPSKLPIIKANTTQENIEKMKVIASANKRSVAKELEWLIERHIAEYEAENGEIVLKEPESIKAIKEWTEMATDKNTPILKRAKNSFKAGMDIGNKMIDEKENKTSMQ